MKRFQRGFLKGKSHIASFMLLENNIARFGFTLAEVLITLGIIGVVAAITMPTLITKYQKHATVNKLKNSYSILVQAFERAKSDYGLDINEWEIQGSTDTEKSKYFAETYLMPYMKVINRCNTSSNCPINGYSPQRYSKRFIVSNGTMYIIKAFESTSGATTALRVHILIVLNPAKKNVKVSRDIFFAELGSAYGTGDFNKILPYGYYSLNGSSVSRSYQLNASDDTACSKNGSRCFAVIMLDGWKISDDYPW